jgi:hypothetical protein
MSETSARARRRALAFGSVLPNTARPPVATRASARPGRCRVGVSLPRPAAGGAAAGAAPAGAAAPAGCARPEPRPGRSGSPDPGLLARLAGDLEHAAADRAAHANARRGDLLRVDAERVPQCGQLALMIVRFAISWVRAWAARSELAQSRLRIDRVDRAGQRLRVRLHLGRELADLRRMGELRRSLVTTPIESVISGTCELGAAAVVADEEAALPILLEYWSGISSEKTSMMSSQQDASARGRR